MGVSNFGFQVLDHMALGSIFLKELAEAIGSVVYHIIYKNRKYFVFVL